MATVGSIVDKVESQAGATGTVGVGIPGSLDPRTGLAKGASSTWLNGRPVAADLRHTLGREIRVEPMTPIVSLCLRRSTALVLGTMSSSP